MPKRKKHHSTDWMLALQLADTCVECDYRPVNPGYSLCQTCYDLRRIQHNCVQCQRPINNTGTCDYCQTLPENATFEQLLAYTNRIGDAVDTTLSSLFETLPKRKITNLTTEECPICCESYNIDDTVTTIPCFHNFHDSCIRKWIVDQNKSTCPVCLLSIKDT